MVLMRDAFPKRFLSGADLGGTQPVWTISAYCQEEMPGGEMKWAHGFEGEQKLFVLNRTNADMCANLFGDDLDDWVGQQVGLYTTPVNFNSRDDRTRSGCGRRPRRSRSSHLLRRRATAQEIDDDQPA